MAVTLWVDADACPGAIREILYRAAQRVQLPLVLVANNPPRVPPSPWISTRQVAAGYDEADKYIAAQAAAGDLVITADIPLAAELIGKGVVVLSPRGEAFTRDNVRQRLNMRDFMETLRASGEQGGGPPPLGERDKQAFANALDRFLARAR